MPWRPLGGERDPKFRTGDLDFVEAASLPGGSGKGLADSAPRKQTVKDIEEKEGEAAREEEKFQEAARLAYEMAKAQKKEKVTKEQAAVKQRVGSVEKIALKATIGAAHTNLKNPVSSQGRVAAALNAEIATMLNDEGRDEGIVKDHQAKRNEYAEKFKSVEELVKEAVDYWGKPLDPPPQEEGKEQK